MIPFSVLHDPITGDVDVSQGLRFTNTLADYVKQRLDENLSFFMNEWFLDLRKGIPYYERIVGAKPDMALIDTLYRRAALLTAGVGSVPVLKSSFDAGNRTASVRFTAKLIDGTTITEADIGRPFLVNF